MTISDEILSSAVGQTITLTADVSENIVVPEGKDVVLDLNGHRVTNATDDSYTIVNEGKLRIVGTGIIDNASAKKGCLVNQNQGEVVIDGDITFELSERTKQTAWYYIVNIGKKMTINSGTVDGLSPNASTIRNGYYSEVNDYGNNPLLVINGGTFGGALIPVKNDTYGVLEINGGTFKSSNECVLNWNKCEINGGTFESTANYTIFSGAYTDPGTDGIISITGGTFTGASGPIKDLTERYNPTSTTAKTEVSGGTYSKKVPEQYWADGFEMYRSNDGTYSIKKSPEWTFPEGGCQGSMRGLSRFIIHNETVEYEAGGFLPPRGFMVECIFGAMAKGGIDAYFNKSTGRIQLYRSGTEVTGVIEDCTIVLIGKQY